VTKFGRDPEELVILPGVRVVVGDTDEEAREIEALDHERDHTFEAALAEFGRPFGWHDFQGYDLDAPFPVGTLRFAERSFFTQAQRITQRAESNGWTLRQAVEATRSRRKSEFVGSPVTVADKLTEWWEARACDGFNIGVDHPANFRRICEEVVPILQERGTFRSGYEGQTLRSHLGLPVPANRYAVDA
jgi:alkanesulfonate monooxygenase SsuD/methylene tetrahydromethanopterin reductase-like flavin-dependent oxidoreductase (luciferase family)